VERGLRDVSLRKVSLLGNQKIWLENRGPRAGSPRLLIGIAALANERFLLLLLLLLYYYYCRDCSRPVGHGSWLFCLRRWLAARAGQREARLRTLWAVRAPRWAACGIGYAATCILEMLSASFNAMSFCTPWSVGWVDCALRRDTVPAVVAARWSPVAKEMYAPLSDTRVMPMGKPLPLRDAERELQLHARPHARERWRG
jgi:hypothetical protein